ncbi:MAG: glycosyltransferase [Roseburia sp.]|nr:glycosyltransferase [Anaeroplasma bactoclasticum]MCM1196270.1 glycosyltransferase [Roseburia sp.]MCM1557377.1 glycosyltransferase [Anaeroplasma bactoclasticum]
MKKILYFTRSMELGGTENVILQLCSNFHKDYDITVLSSGGINLKKLDCLNIKHIEIDKIENKNPFHVIKTYFKIKRIVKKGKYDIIHTHHRMSAFYISLIKPQKCQLVHTMHNAFNDKIKFTNFALKRFCVVACGETVYESIKNNYSLKNVKTIVNGIDNHFEFVSLPRVDQLKKDGKYVLGFVGRLNEQKGVDVLINAMKKLVLEDNKIHLLIYGTGELEDNLKKLVEENNLMEYISFEGFTNSPLNVISQLDCYVLPSRWEGLPLGIIEAFSVKTPVIASNIKENRELVNESTGFLFEKDNPLDLKNTIKICMEQDKSLIIQNAFHLYSSKYLMENFLKGYLNLYILK